MNLKNMTWEAKYDLRKQLEKDLEQMMIKDGFNTTEPFELIPLSESFDEAVEYLKNPDKIEGLTTGYGLLDQCIGGLANEELIIVAGGTGQGKTLYTQCMLMHMALNNIPTLFFTLEMPPRETTIRFMKIIKSMFVPDITRELPIYYYHGTNATLPILDKAIEKGIKLGVKCVVIDHLHFFAKNNENQAAEIGNITREIKLMARRYNIPIILISHIRKTGSPHKTPNLEDLKDSSGIAQDADTVLMVWRDMDTNSTVLKVKVRKSRRRGLLKTLFYKMDENNYLVESQDGEDNEEKI